ncbi:DUF4493 domain-containing protein [Parabacteroides sp.]
MEIKKRRSSTRTMVVFAYISVLIIGLFACDDQKDGSSAHSGKLRLSLNADTTSLKKGVNSNLTKAVADEFEQFLTVEDYKIQILTEKDTVKSYDRFDQLPSEIELPEGAYTIVASKGNDLPAEFENPYFEGSTAFTIKEGMSTPLDVTCTLGNARITLDCTDDFKAAYTDYSVGLKTKFLTDTILEIKKDEIRPAYLQVAKEGTSVSFAIKLKKLGTEEDVTYSGATPLTLQRRQNVRLVLKTDGEALEGIGLDVMLDDSLTSVILDDTIPDFMWKPLGKPEIKGGNGLSEGIKYTMTAGSFEGQPQIEFAMQGGVGALYIKYWHDDENPVVYNLADATDAAEASSEAHFSWVSYLMSDAAQGEPQTNKILDKHVNSGIIYLENAFNSLSSSPKEDEVYTYHFQVYGADATGQAVETETLSFTVIVRPAGSPNVSQNLDFPEIVEGDAMKGDITAHLIAGNGIKEATLTIACSNPQTDETYSLENDEHKKALLSAYGIQVKKDAESKIVITYPKEFSTHLAAPEIGEAIYSFKYSLKDKNDKVEELEKQMTVKAPVFNLLTGDGDAFARRIMLRVDMPVGDENKLSFEYKGGDVTDWTTVESPELTKIANEDNMYVGALKGLTPETSYVVRAIYNNGKRTGQNEVTVTTEEEVELNNGDFEGSWTDKTIPNMFNGENGLDKKTLISNDPVNWATVNSKTFSGKTVTFGVLSTCNSVPSTMKVDGVNGAAVRLRTVGWDNKEGNTSTGICRHVAAGKLFLGTYSYDHENNEDHYDCAYNFTSRPSKVSAMYKYTPYNGDAFKVWAIVENRDGSTVTQLGAGELVKGGTISDWQELSFDITYTNFSKKATHISLVFSSSSNCSDLESTETSNLKGMVKNGEVDGYTHYEGSNLYIDNVTLIYE